MTQVETINAFSVQEIELFYGLKPNSSKIFHLSTSFSETYKIENENTSLFIKVHDSKYFTRKNVYSQIDLLEHLNKHGLKVISPIINANNEYIINSKENAQKFILGYDYFEGKEIIELTKEQNFQLGKNLALIHVKSIDIELDTHKPNYEIKYLFDDALELISPFLERHEIVYLNKLRGELMIKISDVDKDKNTYGICHGDYIQRNTLWSCKGDSMTIDFDFYSYGYRIYDVSHYLWFLKYTKTYNETIWNDYIKGYNAIRKINQSEFNCLNTMMILNHIFMAGERVKLSSVLGNHLLERSFWDRCMNFIYENESTI